jgi:ankyrin repeat protein
VNGADTNEALHCAIKKGNLNMIQYLVEEANVNLSVDKSILRLTRDFEIFKYLVDHGADTHEVLSAAIWSSNGDIVQYLVDNRINGIDANTALSLAVQLGNIGIAKYLVDQGANPNSVEKGWDESTWKCALRNKHEELIAFLNLFPKAKTEPQPAPSTAQAALGERTSYTEVMAKTPTGEGSTPNSDEHSEVDVVNRPHN